ncbi:MAG: sulfotransferase [Pseudomonadota bacterium]
MSLAAHPLAGATAGGLVQLLRSAGVAGRRAWPKLAAFAGLALARSPVTLAETAWLGLRRPRDLPAPLFVVGHWRSGTTHLHNLLSQAPRFSFLNPIAVGLPAERLLLGRPLQPLLARLLPADRGVDQVAVTIDSPQEDEIALASLGAPSYYHAYYLPQRFEATLLRGAFPTGADEARWLARVDDLYARLVVERPDARPLIKNPVYTGRMAALARHWPEARFVRCLRNPYDVVASTAAFHASLLSMLSLEPAPRLDLARITLAVYAEMDRRAAADIAALPAGTVVDVRHEALAADPLRELAQLYDHLGEPGFEQDRPRFERYLGTLAKHRPRRYAVGQAGLARFEAALAEPMGRWGYSVPAWATGESGHG